jgi:hypothetical protein
LFQVIKNPADGVGLGEERNDAHFATAVSANQRVGFENSLDQTCPSFPESGSLLGVWEGLIGLG